VLTVLTRPKQTIMGLMEVTVSFLHEEVMPNFWEITDERNWLELVTLASHREKCMIECQQ